jgi:tetratricopeptide (TPR) repeat protein
MDAVDVLGRLQPLDLIVLSRKASNAGRLIDEVGAMRARGDWDGLDALARTCGAVDTADAPYPALLIHLADAYRQAGHLARAEVYCAKALAILQARTSAASLQNRAVAVSYRALIVHFMDRLGEAIRLYDHAHGDFERAAVVWEREDPGSSRVRQCREAATVLGEAARDTVAIAVQDAEETNGNATGAPVVVEPEDGWQPEVLPSLQPLDPPYVPPAAPASLIDLTFALLIVCCFSLLMGFVTFALGGTAALVVFAATLLGMAAVALVLASSSTGGGFWLRVPYDHVAVVEEDSQPLLVGEVQRWPLVPWSRRLRAIVPLREFTYALPGERVCLGKSAQDDEGRYAALDLQVQYRVIDPVDASYHFARESRSNGAAKSVLRGEDLTRSWESQLAVDVESLLVDELWGATVPACFTHRLQIQENLQNRLATRTRRWGVDVTDVTLLDINPS